MNKNQKLIDFLKEITLNSVVVSDEKRTSVRNDDYDISYNYSVLPNHDFLLTFVMQVLDAKVGSNGVGKNRFNLETKDYVVSKDVILSLIDVIADNLLLQENKDLVNELGEKRVFEVRDEILQILNEKEFSEFDKRHEKTVGQIVVDKGNWNNVLSADFLHRNISAHETVEVEYNFLAKQDGKLKVNHLRLFLPLLCIKENSVLHKYLKLNEKTNIDNFCKDIARDGLKEDLKSYLQYLDVKDTVDNNKDKNFEREKYDI